MKETGMIRKIDELGRIVLPKELRTILNIPAKTPVEIFVNEDLIILKKYECKCMFCNESDNLIEFKNKKVCRQCIDKLKIGEL